MRKRKDLVPAEKNRKIIRLDRRGQTARKRSAGAFLWGCLGIVCLLYCLVIGFCMRFGTFFFLIWGILAVCCGLLSLLLAHRNWVEHLPKWIRVTAVLLFAAGLIVVGTIEAEILGDFNDWPAAGADYCVILGAQWRPDGPSDVLKRRLDAALVYLQDNPETRVIVSGGRGANEPISEAEGMKEYLVRAGMDEERILLEDTSVNTAENLSNSGLLLDKEQERVVLVTSNFHVFRACRIAEKQGYAHLEGLAASTYLPMLPNNLLREFLGVVKDMAVGNM